MFSSTSTAVTKEVALRGADGGAFADGDAERGVAKACWIARFVPEDPGGLFVGNERAGEFAVSVVDGHPDPSTVNDP